MVVGCVRVATGLLGLVFGTLPPVPPGPPLPPLPPPVPPPCRHPHCRDVAAQASQRRRTPAPVGLLRKCSFVRTAQRLRACLLREAATVSSRPAGVVNSARTSTV